MARSTPRERALIAAVAAISALAGLANAQAWPALPRFLIATAALVGLAWLVSFATEQVGGHLGAGATGVLQATVANLPELFVILFALNAGELVVAQTAIIGSMLANALLLLGLVIVVGARRSDGGTMRFSRRMPRETVMLLLAMLFAIVLVSPALGGRLQVGHVQTVSVVSAALLLVLYGAWLAPYLRARDRRSAAEIALARLPLPTAVGLLGIAGVGSAFVSEWFIGALQPAIEVLHVSKPFAGLVIVGIAGNAVEHAASVVLAARRRYDLAVSVVMSSVAQIAGFLFPALVIVSLVLPTQLSFALPSVYIGALALMTLAVWQTAGEGKARAFEGWALIAIYAIVAVVVSFQ